jgi:hypothetical protein
MQRQTRKIFRIFHGLSYFEFANKRAGEKSKEPPETSGDSIVFYIAVGLLWRS